MPKFNHESPGFQNELAKFIDGLEGRGQNTTNFDIIANAYVEALYFTDGQYSDEDSFTTENELSIEAMTSTLVQVWAFWVTVRADVPADADLKRIGRDLWFTRNGHGAGFWDGDWPEPFATRATDASKTLGEVTPYLGDDGLVYLS